MKRPSHSFCKQLLWHFVVDDCARIPDQLPNAISHADYAVANYMKQGWSWFMPEEIVRWHPWFVGAAQ